MKDELYDRIVKAGLTRRGVLKGAAATGGLAAFGGLTLGSPAMAQDDLRAQILAIVQFSFMIAVPISSALLGLLVADTEPLVGLWPGVAMSLALFVYGFSRPALRDYLAPIPGR